MLQQSIKVSLIAASVEQLIYLFFTRCCLLPILPITLQSKTFFWKLVQVVFEDNGGRGTTAWLAVF